MHDIRGNVEAVVDELRITSLGIDVGSATTQALLSRLTLRRTGQSLSSRYAVVKRQVMSESDITFTPYRSDTTIDVETVLGRVTGFLETAGLHPDAVPSGALFLTGVAAERHNAQQLIQAVEGINPHIVATAASPYVEALASVKGAAVLELSRTLPRPSRITFLDIGGGTSKVVVVENGRITDVGVVSVGARLVAFDGDGQVTRLEAAADQLGRRLGLPLGVGSPVAPCKDKLASALAAVLIHFCSGELDKVPAELVIVPFRHTGVNYLSGASLAFAGGVSRYLYGMDDTEYGDLGCLLAQNLSARFQAHLWLTRDQLTTISATVMGASQFSTIVPGATLFWSEHAPWPLRRVPVVRPLFDPEPGADVTQLAQDIETGIQSVAPVCGNAIGIAFDAELPPSYPVLSRLAQAIGVGIRSIPVPIVVFLKSDYGRALGTILEQVVPGKVAAVLDGIHVNEFCNVDIQRGAVGMPELVITVREAVFAERTTPGAAVVSP